MTASKKKARSGGGLESKIHFRRVGGDGIIMLRYSISIKFIFMIPIITYPDVAGVLQSTVTFSTGRSPMMPLPFWTVQILPSVGWVSTVMP